MQIDFCSIFGMEFVRLWTIVVYLKLIFFIVQRIKHLITVIFQELSSYRMIRVVTIIMTMIIMTMMRMIENDD